MPREQKYPKGYKMTKKPASATDPRMKREQYEREGGTGRKANSHVRMGTVKKSPRGY